MLQTITIWLEPVLKKSRHFELFVDTDKVKENLLNYFNIEPWTYNSSKSNLFRKIICLSHDSLLQFPYETFVIGLATHFTFLTCRASMYHHRGCNSQVGNFSARNLLTYSPMRVEIAHNIFFYNNKRLLLRKNEWIHKCTKNKPTKKKKKEPLQEEIPTKQNQIHQITPKKLLILKPNERHEDRHALTSLHSPSWPP